MALKAYTDNLDGIDESLREHYVEKEGGYYLSLDDFGKHPGAVTLKTTLNKVNKEKDMLASQVTDLESKASMLPDDFDADDWARLKAGDGGKTDEAIQALKDQHTRAVEMLRNKHALEVDAISSQVAERDGYIDRSLIDGGLKDSLLDVGVVPALLDGALASLRGNVRVQRADDGSRSAIVETDLGDVGVADFVKEWASSKGKAYLGKAQGPSPEGNNGGRYARSGGDLGGDSGARKSAIADRFPELNK